MSLYDKAKKVDDQISDSSIAYQLKHWLDWLLPVAILAIPVVLYYEFLVDMTAVEQARIL